MIAVPYNIRDDTVTYSPAVGEGKVEIITAVREAPLPKFKEVTESLTFLSPPTWAVFFTIIIGLYLLASVKNVRKSKKVHLSLFWNFVDVILGQSAEIPCRMTTRLIYLNLIFFVLFTKVAFSGVFNTNILVNSPAKQIDSLEDIIDFDLIPGFLNFDNNIEVFKAEKTGIFKQLSDQCDSTPSEMYKEMLTDKHKIKKLAAIAQTQYADLVRATVCRSTRQAMHRSKNKLLQRPKAGIYAKNVSRYFRERLDHG